MMKVSLAEFVGGKEADDAYNKLCELTGLKWDAERTCQNVSSSPDGFLCSGCGWGDFCEPSHLLTKACFAGGGILNYCPNCGARVEEK